MKHVLSFDVEHWYDGNLGRQWAWRPGPGDGRLEREVSDLLELLGEHRVRATFFILGEVAVSHPDVVRAIAAAGHEVACHGFNHTLIRENSPSQYGDDVKRARAVLQDLSGQAVAGFRAPTFSLDQRVPWAVAALLAAGFTYDSSVFPMRTPLYGEPDAPRQPFWLVGPGGERLLELPPAVARPAGVPLPYGGGVYWRVLPLWLLHRLLDAGPGWQVTYLHPWELNERPLALPRALPAWPRLYLRAGVAGARRKLQSLLQAHEFVPFAERLASLDLNALPTYALAGGAAA